MPYNPNAHTMPDTLTGALGEIAEIHPWPMSPRAERRARLTGDSGATDCLIVFDRIKAGGKHNARRVYYDGRFYIKYHRARGGRVYIAGALSWCVLETVSRVYVWDSECDERETEQNVR